jgi:hypothetical protein
MRDRWEQRWASLPKLLEVSSGWGPNPHRGKELALIALGAREPPPAGGGSVGIPRQQDRRQSEQVQHQTSQTA